MPTNSPKVFFGCNYNDKAIKRQFDNLKVKIELDTPFTCVVIDKRASKAAKDIWRDIQDEIANSSGCFFDTTAFRPNVVLELGYALAFKNNDQIFITFRERKTKGSAPKWLLSDIGHLNRHPYKNMLSLERFVRSQLKKLPYYENLEEFNQKCDHTAAPDKYKERGLVVLQKLRDEGDKTDNQIKAILTGTNCHLNKLIGMLKACKLIKRKQGRNARWTLYYGS